MFGLKPISQFDPLPKFKSRCFNPAYSILIMRPYFPTRPISVYGTNIRENWVCKVIIRENLVCQLIIRDNFYM